MTNLSCYLCVELRMCSRWETKHLQLQSKSHFFTFAIWKQQDVGLKPKKTKRPTKSGQMLSKRRKTKSILRLAKGWVLQLPNCLKGRQNLKLPKSSKSLTKMIKV